MLDKNITLRLGDTGAPARIRVSQFDTMWSFVFTIVYNGQKWSVPSGAEAVLNGRKPDGNVFAFSGTVADGKVTVDCDVQMTAVAGPVVCELSVLSGGKVVGTANFILDVEVAPKSPDDVSSESTLPAYGEILDRLAELEQGGGSSITIDATLSDTSGNPVQNKTIKQALDDKVNVVSGKGLSTNDYTTAEKNKLAGIATGANKTTVDTTLSSSSLNPVRNSVITAALAGKADAGAVHSVPSGGTAGQFLVKQSATDYDAAWVSLPAWQGGNY